MAISFKGQSTTRALNDPTGVARLSGAHRFWRIKVVANNGSQYYCQINALELYVSSDLQNVCTDSGSTDIYTASSQSAGGASNAFSGPSNYDFAWITDASSTKYRTSGNTHEPDFPQWLEVEFVEPKDISRATVLCSGNTQQTGPFTILGGIEAAPTRFDIQYSDDGEQWITRMDGEFTWPVEAAADDRNPTAEYFKTVEVVYGVLSALPTLAMEAVGVPGTFQELGINVSFPSLTAKGTIVSEYADLPALTGSGTGFVGNVSRNYEPIKLPSLSASGVLAPGQFGAGSAALPALDAQIAGYQSGDLVGLVLPALSASGQASTGAIGSGSLVLPALSVSVSAIGPDDQIGGVLGALTIQASGFVGTFFGGIQATLPSLTGSIAGTDTGAGIQLPALSATGVAATGQRALFYGYLPALSASGDGILSAPDIIGDGAVAGTLPSLEALGLAVAGNAYEGGAVLPSLTLAATGVTGTLGAASITLPALSATGTMVSGLNGAVSLSLPALRLVASSVAIGDAQLTGAALVMSLKHKAITTFTDYRFNSFATFQGVTLACSEDGLFALVGDDDNGAIIEASITLGNLDFDIQTLKTVDQVYVGYKSDGDLQLSVSADDGTLYSYPLLAQLGDVHHTARVKTGRGIKGRYLQLGISNVAGADFSIDTMEPEPRALNRRIR